MLSINIHLTIITISVSLLWGRQWAWASQIETPTVHSKSILETNGAKIRAKQMIHALGTTFVDYFSQRLTTPGGLQNFTRSGWSHWIATRVEPPSRANTATVAPQCTMSSALCGTFVLAKTMVFLGFPFSSLTCERSASCLEKLAKDDWLCCGWESVPSSDQCSVFKCMHIMQIWIG